MCNACGFGCCAYDGFSKCGCEDCDEFACHAEDCGCDACEWTQDDEPETDDYSFAYREGVI